MVNIQAYKDEIMTKLGGDVLDIKFDISDETLTKVIQQSFREVQSYINVTKLKTVPFADVINMNDPIMKAGTVDVGEDCTAVIDVMRANVGAMGLGGIPQSSGIPDPLYLSMTTKSTGSGMSGGVLDGYLNLMQWRQIANTISTDLRFYYDTLTGKLYINAPNPRPSAVTIAYIPRWRDVSQVREPHWENIILKLALAHSKVLLGRIRGRFNLTNALWQQDAETLLSEGNAELEKLTTELKEENETLMIY